jgi:hypothetical protein
VKLERSRFRLELAAGELLRLDGPGAVEVSCEAGRVWLTEERDTRDVWLEAGERATLAGRGLAVVEAVQAARITLS